MVKRMNQKGRVEHLVTVAGGPGKVRTVYLDYWRRPAEEVDRELAEARAATGPKDTLILVEYTDDWRGAGDVPSGGDADS